MSHWEWQRSRSIAQEHCRGEDKGSSTQNQLMAGPWKRPSRTHPGVAFQESSSIFNKSFNRFLGNCLIVSNLRVSWKRHWKFPSEWGSTEANPAEVSSVSWEKYASGPKVSSLNCSRIASTQHKGLLLYDNILINASHSHMIYIFVVCFLLITFLSGVWDFSLWIYRHEELEASLEEEGLHFIHNASFQSLHAYQTWQLKFSLLVGRVVFQIQVMVFWTYHFINDYAMGDSFAFLPYLTFILPSSSLFSRWKRSQNHQWMF